MCVKVRQSAVEASAVGTLEYPHVQGRVCGMTTVVDWMDVPEILRPRPRRSLHDCDAMLSTALAVPQ